MPEFTEKQKKRLERIAELIQLGPIALAKYLFDLEEKIDAEIPAITNVMERIKGDPGYTPVIGKDYFTEQQVKDFVDEIYSRIKIPQPIDGKTPTPGVDYPTKKQLADYIDIKLSQIPPVFDGYTPKKGLDYFTDNEIKLIIARVLAQVPKPQTGEDFVKGINDLPTDDEDKKIDAAHIKNLPERIVQNIFENGGPGAPFETVVRGDGTTATVRKDASGAYVITAIGGGGGGGYQAPEIVLSASPSQFREKGNTVTAVDLSALTTKHTNDITLVEFYRDNVLIDTVPVPNPAGGTETYTDTTDVTVNTDFKAKVSDGVQTITSNIVSYKFVNKVYIGKSASQTLDEAGIEGLSLALLQAGFAGTYTMAAGGYDWFCFDDALGSPAAFTGFKDGTTGLSIDMADDTVDTFFDHEENGWWYALVSVTNAFGVTVNYRLYRSTFALGGATQAILS